MLASMRFYLRFIELEETFDRHGFAKKVWQPIVRLPSPRRLLMHWTCSTERRSRLQTRRNPVSAPGKDREDTPLDLLPVPVTDFAASLGPDGHSWNVVRSESDDMMFRHAGASGAKTFDQTKVDSLTFEPHAEDGFDAEARLANPGRPVSANWSRKDGTSGTIKFDYIIDASGRNGLISTKYLQNRRYNEGLKNIANWTYWKGANMYNEGKKNEKSPFFEALQDGSGWAWAIPLHNDVLSVGVVARQDIFFAKKKEANVDATTFYKQYLELAPQIKSLLEGAEMVSETRQASDWSYSASAYAGPHFRLVGDAGCFVDPYFSSGVHLAITAGLAAAVSVQAARRAQCSERDAAVWHTTKVAEGYTRFLLIVMAVLRQIRLKDSEILSTEEEEGLDTAFSKIQPVIQGVADTETGNAQVQQHAAASVDFALGSFEVEPTPTQQRAVIAKLESSRAAPDMLEKLTPEELHILSNMGASSLKRGADEVTLAHFTSGVIHGLSATVVRGDLGLRRRNEPLNEKVEISEH